MRKFLLCIILLQVFIDGNCTILPLKVSAGITGKSGLDYHLKISIINQSKSNIRFWMWTCDSSDSFVFNTNEIAFNKVDICDNNYLSAYDLSPNKMYVFKLDVFVKNRNRALNMKNIRLGFIYNKDRIHKEVVWCDKPIKYNW